MHGVFHNSYDHKPTVEEINREPPLESGEGPVCKNRRMYDIVPYSVFLTETRLAFISLGITIFEMEDQRFIYFLTVRIE